MKPKPKPRRYVGYLDGKPFGSIVSTSRMEAWQDLWKRTKRYRDHADESRFVVEQEDEKKPA